MRFRESASLKLPPAMRAAFAAQAADTPCDAAALRRAARRACFSSSFLAKMLAGRRVTFRAATPRRDTPPISPRARVFAARRASLTAAADDDDTDIFADIFAASAKDS